MTVHDSPPAGRPDNGAGTGHRHDETTADRWIPDVARFVAEAGEQRCPVCVALTSPGARSCESCGYPLWSISLAEGDDNHRELDLGPVAGVCDRGIRHTTNDDAMGLAVVGNTLIAVVCDGVSTTPGSAMASGIAATTAVAVIADAVRGRGPGRRPRPGRRNGYSSDDVLDILEPTPPPRTSRPRRDDAGEPTTTPLAVQGMPFTSAQAEEAIRVAVVTAQETIIDRCAETGRPVPSCTFAAAVVTAEADGTTTLTAGWVGDSRIYLFGPRWCERVSDDDTWAAEAARAGIIPAADAETHRRAHTLTRWLGGDAGDVTPHVRVQRLELPATVLVCSDGLWNYASRPDVLATVAAEVPADSSAIELARHLTAYAVDRGGHDNITVVAARVADFRGNR